MFEGGLVEMELLGAVGLEFCWERDGLGLSGCLDWLVDWCGGC